MKGFMAYLEFLLQWGQYFLLAFAIGFPLNLVVCGMMRGRRWIGSIGKALFIPGAILHELGHAIACLVTGKRITGTHFGTSARGGHINFEHTGICTPLAMHALAYAPVISCGIATAAIWNYIFANEAAFELLDYVIWFYLLLSVGAGAAPSMQDMKVAFRSLSARPRVTAVEAISLLWPIILPDLLGVSSDWALLTYLVATVASYIVLWRFLVTPHPHGIRRARGIGNSLPGDGRDPSGERWPNFRQAGTFPITPTFSSPTSRMDIQLPIASVEDVYRAAGLKPKKKTRFEGEVITGA